MSYRYPFTPFPRSWYRIDVHKNKAFAFGRELILETLANDEIRLLDTLNANVLPTIKKNGFIFAFFDERSNPPDFEVPDVPEFNDESWQRPFCHFWRARVHLQEIVENALDLSHFCVVHTYEKMPTLSEFEMDNQRFRVIMHSRRKLFWIEGKITMSINYHGMGVVVAHVISFGGVELKVFLTMTPFDIEYCDIKLAVAIKKTSSKFKNLLLKFIIPKDVKHEFTRDIPVWHSKIYRTKPVLCNSEGNIIRIRKWATQFYL